MVARGQQREFRLVRARPAEPAAALTCDQRAVVEHTSGPLLVLAGPGTGKTSAIVESVAARVAGGERSEHILVLTFSRSAAMGLRARIAARLGNASAPSVMTFHSLCRSLVTAFGESGDGDDGALRLLSAPEQDVVVRDALAGWGAQRWPASLRAALGTDAFVEQVRSVFARARQFGLDPDDVVALGREADKPEWVAAGQFFEEYLRLLDFQRALDYGELVHRARLLLADPVTGSLARGQIRRVYVDEYQDTDPAQAGLLKQLVGPGGPLVVFGDPDQTIYRFRGTSTRAITDFPLQFGLPDQPARIVALESSYRYGPAVGGALANLRSRLPDAGRVETATRRTWRDPIPQGPRGAVRVLQCESDSAQADVVAARLRLAHLDDGVAWSDMAVIVRSARRAIPRLARALASYGVPVEVAGDEVALGDEPAVRPLLLALAVATGRQRLDEATAEALLASPLVEMDALSRRSLGRDLRAADRSAPEPTGASTGELLAAALDSPALLEPHAAGALPALGLARQLAHARDQAQEGASAHEILWDLWAATDWPSRLQAEALGGGDGARAAHRSLDAVCALFDLAQVQAHEFHGDAVGFLDAVSARHIPADTGRDAAGREAVRVLTAHRAKGLEWDVVCVVGAQEGSWPDLRPSPQLLDADRLLPAGLAEPESMAARITDERRLFYVACSRARRELIVTTVSDADGSRPSRFVAELGAPVTLAPLRTARPRTLAGLTAELRCVASDESASAELREGAALRLAQLADEVDSAGRPLAPWADPERWWGVLEPSGRANLVGSDDQPVRLTGSGLHLLLECPRRWFLEQGARLQEPRVGASSLGSVVHAIVEQAERQGLDYDDCVELLDQIWPELTFGAAWKSDPERASAREMLRRFERWHRSRDAELVGVEVPFDVVIDLGTDKVRLTGSVDRLERVGDRLRVVDYKTGSAVPTAKDAHTLPQFGVYQLAVAAGAFRRSASSDQPAGAVGVYLRNESRGAVKEVAQPSLADHPWPPEVEATDQPTWAHDQLARAAATVRQGEFPAQACAGCRFCSFRSACPVQAEGEQVHV